VFARRKALASAAAIDPCIAVNDCGRSYCGTLAEIATAGKRMSSCGIVDGVATICAGSVFDGSIDVAATAVVPLVALAIATVRETRMTGAAHEPPQVPGGEISGTPVPHC